MYISHRWLHIYYTILRLHLPFTFIIIFSIFVVVAIQTEHFLQSIHLFFPKLFFSSITVPFSLINLSLQFHKLPIELKLSEEEKCNVKKWILQYKKKLKT